MRNDTVYLSKINFDDYFEKITALFCQNKLTISWSSSGPLENENGGYTRYGVENKGRPICFLETCSVGEMVILRVYLINERTSKRWDSDLKKDPNLFGSSRYYANAVSSCLDGIYFEAMDHRYLAYEIAGQRIRAEQKEKLKELFDAFLKKVQNTGDHYFFDNLKDWFKRNF